MGLGTSILNQTASTLLLLESSKPPTPSHSVSTKGQHKAQSSFLQRPAGRGRGCSMPREPPPSVITCLAVPDQRSTMDHSIAGDLQVLLVADIKDHGKGKARAEDVYSSDTLGTDAGTRLHQVRHWRDCSTSKGSSSKTCAVPDLRQRLPLVIQHRAGQGSCESSTKGSRARLGCWDHSIPSSKLLSCSRHSEVPVGTVTQWT